MLVALDGPGNSGKSTLARRLGAGAVVTMDDFYRPSPDDERATLDPQAGYELYFDWQRLIAEVLDPLAVGDVARYRRYDWSSGALGPDSVEVAPRGLVVVEGVYASRPQLRGYYDLAVFVDAPRAVRLERARTRGGDQAWIARWTAAEDWWLEHLRPAEKADLVVSGMSG